MKRVFSVLLLIVMMVLLTSCTENQIGDTAGRAFENLDVSAEVKDFFMYMAKGDYQEAVDLYYEKIQGNSTKEDEATSACEAYFEQINSEYLNGIITKDIAEKEVAKVTYVEKEIGIFLDDKYAHYNEISVSKEDFVEGKALFEAKRYFDSIERLDRVMQDDSNYEEAQNMILISTKNQKEKSIKEAEEKILKNDYAGAVTLLKQVLNIIPQDEDVLKLISKYETEFCQREIQIAADACKKPTTDWETALKIIKSAQQVFPENNSLLEAEKLYTSYSPVSLFDLQLFSKSNNFEISSATDNVGNVYEKCMAHKHTGSTNNYWDGSDETRPMNAIYLLESKYNKLTFTVAVEEGSEEQKCYMTVKIYGDNRLLYSAGNLKSSTMPIKGEVDVTGIKQLKVSIVYDGPTGNTYYIHSGTVRDAIFANATVQKTK